MTENNKINKTNDLNENNKTTDYSKMSKDEIIKKLNETETKISELEKSNGQDLKTRIKNMIESGYNTIESISEKLECSNKNVSSYLTYIRKELKQNGEWIVSTKLEQGGSTYLAKVKLSDLGWTKVNK